MKTNPITVHIIIDRKSGLKNPQNISVRLTEFGKIKEFRSIVDAQRHEKAMLFALANGSLIDPADAKGPIQLTLTKENAYWDLIG